MVIDKVKLAQRKADEAKVVMRQNVKIASENVKLLDEEVVPTAIELAARAYNVQEQALEVLHEEQKRQNRIVFVLFVGGGIGAAGAAFYFFVGF